MHHFRKRHRILATGAIAISAILAMSGCAAASESLPKTEAEEELIDPIKISVAHTMLEANPANQVVLKVAERIKKSTNGKILLEVFGASQLGNTTETTEQASLGQPVISYLDASTASTHGVEEFALLGAPFLVSKYEDVERIVDSKLFAGWTEKLAESANLRILGLNWLAGPRNIVGPKAFTKPADLQGTKIRIPPLPTWEALFGTVLKSTPVTVNASELYPAMQQGVVDAAEMDMPSIRDYGLYQDILLKEFRAGGIEATELATTRGAEARKEMEAKGVTFHQGDVAAYRKATAGFYGAFPNWNKDTVAKLLAIRDGK